MAPRAAASAQAAASGEAAAAAGSSTLAAQRPSGRVNLQLYPYAVPWGGYGGAHTGMACRELSYPGGRGGQDLSQAVRKIKFCAPPSSAAIAKAS